MNKYDVAIAYRIYPGVSKVPPVHSDDKYKLSELCLKSLKKSLSGLKVKFWALLDNCPEEYTELFRNYFDDNELEIINLPGIGNNGTFQKQVEILSAQNESEIVYFAEDDYFYLPDTFIEMVGLIRNNKDIKFVTPYDHPDYYNLDIHKYDSEIITFNNRHWRTVSTTCMTFLTTKTALQKHRKTFLSYSRRNDDSSMWLSLTKKKVYNPALTAKFLFKNKPMFKIIGKAWYFGWPRLLFGKKEKLWSPVPSLGTHMDSMFLAPNIDWYEKFNKEDE